MALATAVIAGDRGPREDREQDREPAAASRLASSTAPQREAAALSAKRSPPGGRVAPSSRLDWKSDNDFRGVNSLGSSNVNVVVITGNLTRDPELRSTGGGTSVCEMRVAVNSRRKNGQSGQWVDKPNYFDVVVFGAQADNCATYLQRGRPVAVEGRLDWREWEAKDGSGKRQAVQVIANTVQFLGSRDGGGARTATAAAASSSRTPPSKATSPPTKSDFGRFSAGGGGQKTTSPFEPPHLAPVGH